MSKTIGFELEQQCAILRGDLTFATVNGFIKQGHAHLLAHAFEQVNLAHVTHTDSAGLALLLGWLRHARKHQIPLRFLHVPSQLRALAQVGGVDAILFTH